MSPRIPTYESFIAGLVYEGKAAKAKGAVKVATTPKGNKVYGAWVTALADTPENRKIAPDLTHFSWIKDVTGLDFVPWAQQPRIEDWFDEMDEMGDIAYSMNPKKLANKKEDPNVGLLVFTGEAEDEAMTFIRRWSDARRKYWKAADSL